MEPQANAFCRSIILAVTLSDEFKNIEIFLKFDPYWNALAASPAVRL